MDNLTHTLVGATLGRTGLAAHTRLGMAALMIGANIPDLDVLGLPFGWNLGFRRGITHGLPALLLWPFVVAAALVGWHRWRLRRRGTTPTPLVPRQLLLLATIGVVSHPLLDWFNSYGMRWLMPIDGRWWYGDTWFIVDPGVLVALILALVLSRPGSAGVARPVPARIGVAVVAGYALLMGLGTVVGRRAVRGTLDDLGFARVRSLMVTPVALNPLVRLVVVDDGAAYHRGTVGLAAPLRLPAGARIETGMGDIDRATVERDAQGEQFLRWARFPFARVHQEGDTVVTVLDDARYSDGQRPSFARTEVRTPSRRP